MLLCHIKFHSPFRNGFYQIPSFIMFLAYRKCLFYLFLFYFLFCLVRRKFSFHMFFICPINRIWTNVYGISSSWLLPIVNFFSTSQLLFSPKILFHARNVYASFYLSKYSFRYTETSENYILVTCVSLSLFCFLFEHIVFFSAQLTKPY